VKKIILSALIAATALTSAPALADRDHRHYRDRHYDRYDDDDRRYQRTDNGIRYWRGNDGRYYCKRSNGTILGAAAGALLGREVDRGRSRCR
jgi:hypothetical protein